MSWENTFIIRFKSCNRRRGNLPGLPGDEDRDGFGRHSALDNKYRTRGVGVGGFPPEVNVQCQFAEVKIPKRHMANICADVGRLQQTFKKMLAPECERL